MKKPVKIIAIGFATLALSLHLHGAFATLYGISNYSLPKQVMGQGVETGETSSSGGSSTGGGTSTSASVLGVEQTYGCNVSETTVTDVKVYGDYGATATIGYTGSTMTGISIGYSGSYNISTTSVTLITAGSKSECVGWDGWCWSRSCEYSTGTKPSYVFFNGTNYTATSSVSTSN